MPLAITPQYQRCGITGTIDRYSVLVVGDRITVVDDTGVVADRTVAELAAFVLKAEALRVGWAVLPGGDEVLYLYDRNDHNFGYALNLAADWCSEWGYAPFACDQCETRKEVNADANPG